MTAADIQNRCFNKHIDKTAYKMFTGLKRNLIKMHILGLIHYACKQKIACPKCTKHICRLQ